MGDLHDFESSRLHFCATVWEATQATWSWPCVGETVCFLDGSGNSTNQLRLIVCSHFLPLLTDGFGDRSHVIKTCPQFQAPGGDVFGEHVIPKEMCVCVCVCVIGLVHAKSPILIIARVIVDAWEKRKAQVIY